MFRFSLMALLAFSIPVFGQISPEQAAIRLREREAAKVSATTRQSEISQSDVDAMQQEIQSLREQITALKKEIASLKPQPAAPIATKTIGNQKLRWFLANNADREEWVKAVDRVDATQKATDKGITNPTIRIAKPEESLRLDTAEADAPVGVHDFNKKIKKGMTLAEATTVLGAPDGTDEHGDGSKTVSWRAYHYSDVSSGSFSGGGSNGGRSKRTIEREVRAQFSPDGTVKDFIDSK